VAIIKSKHPGVLAIVEKNVDLPGHGNYELLQLSVSVPTALDTGRYIVQVVDASNLKRNVFAGLYKRKIPAEVRHFRQIH
jgi:hypothetical protein